MAKKFDYYGAKDAGYTDEEIMQHLSETRPDFDFKGAMEAGYSPAEINEHLALPSKAASVVAAPIKGVAKGVQNLPSLSIGPIPAKLGKKIIEHWLPTRRETAEKLLERGGELATAVAVGPEGLVEKGVMTGLGALGGHAAEVSGLGEGAQIASEVVAMSFPGLIKSLGSKVLSSLRKGFTKGAGEVVAKTANITPAQVNEGVREAAQRLGVLEEIPLSAQVKNPLVQSVETKLMQSQTGGAIQEKLERAGEKLVETYKDVGKSLSQRENLLPSVVSEEAGNRLRAMEEATENAYNSLYSQSDKVLPASAVINQKLGSAVHKVIDNAINKLNTELGTPSKDAILNRLKRLKERLSATPDLEAGFIPVKTMIDLKRDLNQVIKYEAKGGVDKLLIPLQQITKNAIQTYGKNYNQAFLNRFNQAEKLFGENAQTFRKNPMLKSLLKGERPEQIFGKMNTVKGINDLEKVFHKTAEGKDTLDALKKYKLEDLLNKKVLDKNGNISWGKASGMFKEPKNRDLVIKLVGPEQYRKLKDLSKVASGVEEGFKKFLNTSKTATTAFDMMVLVGLPIKAAQQLFTGNVLGAVKTTASILAPGQLAKLISNPEFVEAAIQTAKAGKRNNPTKFLEWGQRVAQLTANEMISSFQQPEEAKTTTQGMQQ